MGPGVFRRPGVQHRVPAEQGVPGFHPQPVQGGQQSLRIGLVARHVSAADDQIHRVRQTEALQNDLDGVPPLGADDGRFDPLGLQPPEQLRRAGEEDGLPPLALHRHLGEQSPEPGLVVRVKVPGEHGVGVLQQIADGGAHRLPLRGGPAQAGKPVDEAGHDGVGAVPQGVVKIEAYRFEHGVSSVLRPGGALFHLTTEKYFPQPFDLRGVFLYNRHKDPGESEEEHDGKVKCEI